MNLIADITSSLSVIEDFLTGQSIFDNGDKKGANENHLLFNGSLNLSCRKEESRKSSFGFHF